MWGNCCDGLAGGALFLLSRSFDPCYSVHFSPHSISWRAVCSFLVCGVVVVCVWCSCADGMEFGCPRVCLVWTGGSP